MSLSVAPINFKAEKSSNKNPISKTGETANLAKATFVAGMGLGAKLLFELLDDEFLIEHASDIAGKMVDKNKSDLSLLKRSLCKAGGTIGLLVAAVAIFASIYTLIKSPNIAYESKINTFKKGQEMDVFIKQKQAQKGIYEQLNQEAKNSKDKEKLKEQYMKMEMSKTKKPDFLERFNKKSSG